MLMLKRINLSVALINHIGVEQPVSHALSITTLLLRLAILVLKDKHFLVALINVNLLNQENLILSIYSMLLDDSIPKYLLNSSNLSFYLFYSFYLSNYFFSFK